MKIPRPLHRWSVTPKQAVAVQRRLANRIRPRPLKKPIRLVAGLDAAFSPDGTRCIAGVVCWDVYERRVVEEHFATRPLTFPYVPGLLSFREAPALLAVLRRLKAQPDVLMCDGQGLAHPRRIGIASHVGLLTDTPSIGCAKSRLTGEHDEPGPRRGERTRLTDSDETIGLVLRTRSNVKPVYVSVGHLADLAGAAELVLECAAGYRLPEPTRLADRLVAKAKRRMVLPREVGAS